MVNLIINLVLNNNNNNYNNYNNYNNCRLKSMTKELKDLIEDSGDVDILIIAKTSE